MNFEQRSFLTRIATAASLPVATLSLFVAGCASNPPPPPPPPPPAAVITAPTQFALTADELAQLRKADPDTYNRVQALQPLNLNDVKVMAMLGFKPDVIIAQVRNSRTVFHLTADEIINLKNDGVSTVVINFLIATPNSIGGMSPVPEPQANYAAQTPPPPPPTEVQPPAPSPDYVWVGGDWVWNGGWVWTGGHWAYPPYPGAIWFGGGWRRGGWGWGRGGYRHYGGHWR